MSDTRSIRDAADLDEEFPPLAQSAEWMTVDPSILSHGAFALQNNMAALANRHDQYYRAILRKFIAYKATTRSSLRASGTPTSETPEPGHQDTSATLSPTSSVGSSVIETTESKDARSQEEPAAAKQPGKQAGDQRGHSEVDAKKEVEEAEEAKSEGDVREYEDVVVDPA